MAPTKIEQDLTPEQIKIYEEYLKTGKINGVEIDNQFALAREIGTSVGRLNKWHQEQSKRYRHEKEEAIHDLEILQKKTENELINTIVKVALCIILSVLLITTIIYVMFTVNHYETKMIESTWGNTISILLTNSLSIIGTIMGVKYVNNKN